MQRLIVGLFAVVITLGLASIPDANAKRFGGGMSFGKQHSAPKMHQSSPSAPRAANTSQRGSSRSGMMGMLGGLAMGGLLGALFFGGAFDGINGFDLFLLLAIAAGLFFFFRARAKKAAMNQNTYAYAGSSPQQSQEVFAQAGTEAHQGMQTQQKLSVDVAQFSKAAREIFMRMQAASDSKNIQEIRQFSTAEMALSIEEQLQNSNERTQTEVATLDAEILETWSEGKLSYVSVGFSALINERSFDANDQLISEELHQQIKETWIFQQQQHSDDPTWYLAGIQQASA